MRAKYTLVGLALLLAFLSLNEAEALAIDFENLSDSTPLSSQFGIVFSNATVLTSGISLNEFEFPPHSGVNVVFDDGGAVTLTFGTPISQFGAYFTHLVPLTLTFYDAFNILLGTVGSASSSNLALSGSAGSSPNEFITFSSPSGISKVIITGDPKGTSFAMDDVNFITNRLPVALCRNVTVVAGPNCNSNASIDNGSYDPDGDSITLTQAPAGPYPLANTLITLTVTDSKGAFNQCKGTVTVIDITQPTLNLPADVTVPTDPGQCSAVVNYTVTVGDNCTGVTLANNPQSGSTFQKGTTTVNATATDAARNTATSSFKVTVVDKGKPTISNVSATPSVLWPPNHKMVDVAVNYNAADNCGQPACQIRSVTTNEPIGSSDYSIVDSHHVKLSADRLGSGNGRIYTITITCTDASANSSGQAVTVNVPHDEGKK